MLNFVRDRIHVYTFYESSSIWPSFHIYGEYDVTLCWLMSKHQNIVYKTNLKFEISMRKNTRKCLYIALVNFSLMLFTLYDPRFCFMISLLTVHFKFTSRIGQLWNLAKLNDVRGISMLSAKNRRMAKTGDGTICVSRGKVISTISDCTISACARSALIT